MKAFALSAILTYGAVLAIGQAVDPGRMCSYMAQACALFVGLPVLMALSMLSLFLPLSAFLILIGLLFAWGRPSGAPELVRELLALPLSIVPGYIAALRRVRSPAVWGFVTGGFVVTVTMIVALSLRGPA